MSEDAPLYNGPTIVVTTDDGALFSCTPFVMGGVSATRQVRWTLIDAQGLEYIGPQYARGQSPTDVQRLVSEWWEFLGLRWAGPDRPCRARKRSG